MKSMFKIAMIALVFTSYGAQAKGGCRTIEKLCKAAHHKKHKDCYDKILAGEKVEAVTAEAADVEACKAKEKRK